MSRSRIFVGLGIVSAVTVGASAQPTPPQPAQPRPAQPAQPRPAQPAQPQPAQPRPAQPQPAQPRPPAPPAQPQPAQPQPAQQPAAPPAQPQPAQPSDPQPPATPPADAAPPASPSPGSDPAPAPAPAPAAPAAPAPPAPPAPPNDTSVTATAPAITAKVRGRALSNSGDPIPGALVTVVGTTSSTLADANGNFELEAPVGARTLEIEATGFATLRSPITVAAGMVPADLRLAVGGLPGEEIVVVGSRLPEKRLDAPVTIEIATEKDLQTAPGASYLSALSRVKGIDFSDSGLIDQRISARGFPTQFNSRMVMMVDGRLAQQPGTGLPQNNLLPVGILDMKAAEVVVGPASALYGPNAHTGVINIVTKTPWDESGAAIAIKGGTQSMFSGATRIAGTVKERFGWKVNGEYMRAEDFKPERASNTHYYGTTVFEGDVLSDYDVRSMKVDGTGYYRQGDWLASAGTGLSDLTGMQITNSGRNHLRDWQINYQTAQVSGPHVYAQVTRTGTDAGRTYQVGRLVRAVAMMGGAPADPHELDAMRDDLKFIDNSSMIDSDLQLRYTYAGVKATVGGQLRRYMPVSEGTYLDDKDKTISATEAGSYVQLDTTLKERLRLAAAARVDTHSLYPTQFSPKLAVQYEVAPSHNVRVSYNRAFKSPTILENFLFINNNQLGNRTGFVIHDTSADGPVIAEIDPLRPEQVDSFEAGYKGAVADKVYVDVVGYQSWYRDFISPQTTIANPKAAMMPTFATYPDGTPTAAGLPNEGSLSTYINFGKAQVRGADLGVDVRPIPEVTVSGSVSLIKLASFENDSALQKDLLLNVPTVKLRGSVQVDDLPIEHAFGRLDGRYRNRFAFESGYWSSETLLGRKMSKRAVVDLTLGYRLPKYGMTISGTVANLFDDNVPDVLGAPEPGRYAWLQVMYDYKGLHL
jgi:outer membrane receptor for ferrienterochelin and colicins